MFDLQQLRYFVAVAEQEHVGRAAAMLNITQSPLSRQIQALEARIGLALFVRERQRIRLTPAGRSLLAEARTLLAQIEGAERRTRAMAAGTGGTLAIAYVDGALHSGALTLALDALRRDAPGAEVGLQPMRSAAQFAALDSGTIDIGFAYRAPPSTTTLIVRRVVCEPYMLAIAPDRAAAPSAADLDGAAFIAPPAAANPAARDLLIAACIRAGFTPAIHHEATGPLSAMAMVAAGLGYAFVQQSLSHAAPSGVTLIPPPAGFDLAMEVHAVWRADITALGRRFVSGLAMA